MSVSEPQDSQSFTRYIVLVLIATPVFAAVLYVALLLSSSLSCGQGYTQADKFLGYCETTWFGDYEHAAVAYNMKPAFSRNVAAADVLFLGDSRMQTAVSTEAVHEYFLGKHIPFFAFGFGYGETAQFPLTMLQRLKARPKVVVINADGFFSGKMSPVAAAILDGSKWERATTYLHYLPKVVFEQNAHDLCALAGPLCKGRQQPRSWMRSVDDGRWTWINGDPDRADRSIGETRDRPFDPAVAMRQRTIAYQAIAQLQALKLDRSCIILTGVPNPVFQSEAWAKTLAGTVNLLFIDPHLSGLAVRDGLHLNQPSAEIWSGALLRQAEPIIEKCLADARR